MTYAFLDENSAVLQKLYFSIHTYLKKQFVTGPVKTGHICTNYTCSEKGISYMVKLSKGKTFADFLANRESFPLESFAVYST